MVFWNFHEFSLFGAFFHLEICKDYGWILLTKLLDFRPKPCLPQLFFAVRFFLGGFLSTPRVDVGCSLPPKEKSQKKTINIYGGFRKLWYPTTIGFPTKNYHFEVFWGYHHLRKHPYILYKNLEPVCPLFLGFDQVWSLLKRPFL